MRVESCQKIPNLIKTAKYLKVAEGILLGVVSRHILESTEVRGYNRKPQRAKLHEMVKPATITPTSATKYQAKFTLVTSLTVTLSKSRQFSRSLFPCVRAFVPLSEDAEKSL